jgi:hypothetical protein
VEQVGILDDGARRSGAWRNASRAVHDSLPRALLWPALTCAAMLGVASVTCSLAHVSIAALFVPYLSVSAGVTVAVLLISMFLWVVAMARFRAEAPVRTVVERLRAQAPLLLLPVVILPLFLVGYTAAKTATPLLVGFGWDPFWANADRLIFGDDAWRIAQHLLGLKWMPFYAWFYTMGWGGAFMGVTTAVAINGRPARVGVFYTAMLLSWLVGGWAMAMAFSAAGPVFAPLFHPELGSRFASIGQAIAANLPAGDSLRLTQKYLAGSVGTHSAVKGGGISAMPSMHLAAASIYVIAARRTFWLVPAVLFWAMIFLCSAYFGYHYWVDGLAAAAVAAGCWFVAERLFEGPAEASGRAQA